MNDINTIMKQTDENLIPFYNRLKKAFIKAKDHYLYDVEDNEYIDFSAGISVVNMGHCNKTINEAVKKQMDSIGHISNIFYIPGQVELARLISKRSFPGKSFFCNSGAEANEAAIKIARYIGNKKRPGKNKLLALTGSFHGRTIASISLTGQDKHKKGFEPLLSNIDFVEYNSIESLKSKFDDDVCAIFLEAVQGEWGIRPLSVEFVYQVNKIAKKFDAMIIFDEVQTGIGRTGKNFGYQWFDIQPDMISIAKALGNGLPIGAIHAIPEIADELPAGLHAATFGGNYIAITAAIEVLKLLNDELLTKINDLSAYIKEKLLKLKESKPSKIGDIRIIGLMVAMDIKNENVADVINKLLDQNFVTLRAGENALRLLPPFTITKREIDLLIKALREVL